MRLFFAIELPAEVQAALGRLRPKEDNRDYRWPDPALLHVTLAFLGEQPDSQLDAWIKQADRTGNIEWPLGPQTDDALRRKFDQVCQRIDLLTRAQIARAVLGSEGGGLLAAIDRRHKLEHQSGPGTGGDSHEPEELRDAAERLLPQLRPDDQEVLRAALEGRLADMTPTRSKRDLRNSRRRMRRKWKEQQG